MLMLPDALAHALDRDMYTAKQQPRTGWEAVPHDIRQGLHREAFLLRSLGKIFSVLTLQCRGITLLP